MKNYIQEGRMITVAAPTGGATSGDGVVIGALFEVASKTAAAGETVTLATTGVFDLPKKAGAAINAGDKLTWSVSDGAFIKGAGVTGDTLGGAVCVASALSADTVIRVKLLPGTGATV